MMHKIALILLIWLIASLMPTSISHQQTIAQQSMDIETIISEMTLRQKVGQLFMVNLYGTQLSTADIELLTTVQPGAVSIFGYNTEGQSPEQVRQLINTMQRNSQIPLIVSTDHEGGRVQRIQNGVTQLPSPLFLGAITTPTPIESVGFAVGQELRALGVNMNLAPVADLSTRIDLLRRVRVMNSRTWGEVPARVGWQVAAYSDGMAQAGVIGVLKHFPGHGGTPDTHAGLVAVDVDEETAYAQAFNAFAIAIENGVPAVMVGHLIYTDFDNEYPATLSPILMNILRNDFGFDGVIMSDAMDMGALAENYYVPDAAVQFFMAGGDMFVTGPYLTRSNLNGSIDAVINAVETGELSEARVDASVRRILQLKADYGILDSSTLPELDITTTIDALQTAYQAAATVVQDTSNLLPLQTEDNILLIYHNLSPNVLASCETYYPNLTTHAYNFTPFDWELGQVSSLSQQADTVIMVTDSAYNNDPQLALIKLLPPEKTILVALELPYLFEDFSDFSTLVTLYSNHSASQRAVCPALFGEGNASTGILPISIEGFPVEE